MADCAFVFGFISSNVGDVAITAGAIELVRRSGMLGSCKVVVPRMSSRSRRAWKGISGGYPSFSAVEWDFHQDERPGAPTAADLDEASRSDILRQMGIADVNCLIYPGGEHLFSYGGSTQDWALLNRVRPYLAAATAGKSIVVLPTTFGPFKSEFSQIAIERFFRASSLVMIRDEVSKELLKPFPVAPVFGLDPAFFVNVGPKRQPVHPASINVIMRLDQFGLRPGREASSATAALVGTDGYDASLSYRLHRDACRLLLENGQAVRLFIQCNADDAPTRALHAELSQSWPDCISLLRPRSPDAFISDLAGGRATLTSRLHSAIFSLMMGTPTIGIFFEEHGHKLPGVFQALGVRNACFSASAKNLQSIVQAVIGASSGPSEFEGIRERIDGLRNATVGALASHLPQVDATYSLGSHIRSRLRWLG